MFELLSSHLIAYLCVSYQTFMLLKWQAFILTDLVLRQTFIPTAYISRRHHLQGPLGILTLLGLLVLVYLFLNRLYFVWMTKFSHFAGINKRIIDSCIVIFIIIFIVIIIIFLEGGGAVYILTFFLKNINSTTNFLPKFFI